MACSCPECGSSDVQGHEDPEFDAIGVLECQGCGFSGLDDDFDADDGVDAGS